MATGENVVTQADQFQQLMSAINAGQTKMDSKFKAEVRLGQEEATAKALKRVRLERPYTYRRKGNEEQVGFNKSLLEAQAEIASDPSALNQAREAIKTGLKLLAERQNLIKIAEHGRGVIAEYTADELADDSNDEKRLEKAEKAFYSMCLL